MTTYIGIDPGVNCGFAWYEPESNFLMLDTLSFWELIGKLTTFLGAVPKPVVYIEDPNENKPVFYRGLTIKKNTKVAQNVGSNKRDAQLIIEWCKDHGLIVVPVKPTKGSLTKLTAEQFALITGYKGRTSQHARDAAMTFWGLK